MGRELRRVPLDFDWPQGQVWKGYICPHRSINCTVCDQSGYNPETKKLYNAWYSLDKVEWQYITSGRRFNKLAWSYNLDQEDVQALVDGNRLWDFTRTWTRGDGWVEKDPPYVPTAAEVNEWSKHGIGHDSCNAHICAAAKAKRLGVYGLCSKCEGKGHYYADKEEEQLAEEWKSTDPPKGDGYQLWETTSEGSPVSPVFKMIQDLCLWCAENATTFGSFKASADEWRSMLDEDFVRHEQGNMVFI